MKRFRDNKLNYRRVFENRNGEYSPNAEKKALRYWDHKTDADIEEQQRRRYKDDTKY